MNNEMNKYAAGGEIVARLGEAGSGVLTTLALLSIAATGFAGYTAGWIGAQMTAKGKNDLDNVRNEYLDARMSADIAEEEQKLKNEYKARNTNAAPKQMRLF